jgi:O-antigen/teichoic acid export membrane protein
MTDIRKKLAIQFIATNGATVAAFVLSIILSRLLSPSEIGIYSLTAAAVGFAHVFRDFGVASYIRQQKELTGEMVRAAMGVLICSSWSIALILFCLSGAIADYFGQPGVKDAMHVVAVGFLFIPFGAIPQAALAREMQVEKNALVTAISTTVYFGSCVTLAYMGFSYMSMAWAGLINIVTCSFLYSLLRPAGMPVLPSLQGWGSVVNFGFGAMLASATRAVDAAMADVLLGKLSGPHFVGIFSRANSTVNIFNHISGPTINYMALPYLAKVHHRGEAVSQEVVRAIAFITGLIWPALLATSVLGADLIEVLYGSRWLECVEAIPWLCVVVATQASTSFLQPAFTGVGRPYLAAFPLMLSVGLKVAAALLLFNGSLASFAQAYMLAELAALPVYILLAWRVFGMNRADWWQGLHKSVALLFLFALGLLGCAWLLQGFNTAYVRLLVAIAVLTPVWIGAAFLSHHPLRLELLRLGTMVKGFSIR